MMNDDIYSKYHLALGVLQQQFNVLSKEYSKLVENNPIEHFKYRLKSKHSIEDKLLKLKNRAIKNGINPGNEYEFNVVNIEKRLDDVLGVRVVCPFISDVYKVRDQIKECFNIQVVEERDYIKNPKLNGYSSYHMKILVPVLLPNTDKEEFVKAEIQIRTISMDVAASLEHKIFYKKNVVLLSEMQDKISKIFFYCTALDKYLESVLIREKNNKRIKKLYNIYPNFMKSDEYISYTNLHNEALVRLRMIFRDISESYNDYRETNPIEHIKLRVKSNDRVLEKLKRQNKKYTFENVKEYVQDLAGIRIVCPFLGDIEEVIRRIKEYTILEVIEEQDFINYPKENGYASYHMVVRIPIQVNGVMEYPKIEIQIRTMAQEMWAITEEKLCYQKKVSHPTKTSEELKKLADSLRDFDNSMNEIIQYSREQQNLLNKKKKILSKEI